MQGLEVRNYKITNEKLQPTNNNVYKFTSNKTYASIAQNYKIASLQVHKLQNKIK